MGDQNKNKLFSLKELEALFFKEELPGWWNVSIDKITFRVLEEIILFTEKKNLSHSSILSPLSNLHGTDVTPFVKHAGNFQLHTVITYSLAENTYYYHPFTKNRAGKYKGLYKDGKFIVYFNENRRLIFERTEEGAFHEYGEQLKNGKWEKYFEDLFYPTSSR